MRRKSCTVGMRNAVPRNHQNKIFFSLNKKSWARIESIKCYPCEQLQKSFTLGSCLVGRLFKLWRKDGARPDKWIFTLNFKTTVNHWWSVFTFVEHNNNITIQAGFSKAILFVLSFISEMSDRSTYKVYQLTTVRELEIELRFLTGTRLRFNIALKYDILKDSLVTVLFGVQGRGMPVITPPR